MAPGGSSGSAAAGRYAPIRFRAVAAAGGVEDFDARAASLRAPLRSNEQCFILCAHRCYPKTASRLDHLHCDSAGSYTDWRRMCCGDLDWPGVCGGVGATTRQVGRLMRDYVMCLVMLLNDLNGAAARIHDSNLRRRPGDDGEVWELPDGMRIVVWRYAASWAG